MARWQTAAAVEPTFFPAQVNLGRLFERKQRQADAVTVYRAATATRAEHPEVAFAARRLSQLGSTPEQALEVRGWMQAATDAITANRPDEAQRLFERIVAALPTQAPANLALALVAANRGRTIEAMRLLTRGLDGDPDYFPALFLLAELQAGQGQFDEALLHYQRVAQLLGPVREGLEARRRLPALEEARDKLAAIKGGLSIEATRSFSEGVAAFERLDYEAAFTAFTRASALNEQNPYAAFNRGLAAFNLGNTVVAARSFERVLDLLPTYGLAHFWLGVLFQASAEQARDARNLPEAQAEYGATLQRLTLAIANGEGAWYLDEARKRRAEASEFLDRFQEGQGWLTLGGVLGAQGRLTQSLNAFVESSQRFPYDFQPFLNIGVILTDLKEYGQAQKALEQAAVVNPQSPKPPMNLGLLFEAQERWEDALAAYQRAAELAPDSPPPPASMGAVLLKLERYEEAIRAFERNVELSGGTSSAIVHWGLAFLYGQNRQGALALRHYRKTRELLAGRTEPEAVDMRRASEDSIATLEQRLKPYRVTLHATPWSYDSNLASSRTDPVGEISTGVGGSLTYTLVNEERLKLRGTLDHNQSYSLVFRQAASTSTGVAASGDYTLSPVLEVGGSYRWSYSHGNRGPQSLGQSLNASLTRRGQVPSSLTLGLSYGTTSGLGASTTRNANAGYSVSMNQSIGIEGSLSASVSASANDANRDDQVTQSKSLNFGYSRRLWGAVSASLSYGLGFTDFVNPTREAVVRGGTTITSLVSRHSVSKSYGVDLSYQFRNDLVISLGLNMVRNESSFSLDREEDLDELLNNLVQAAGSYRKRTAALSVSKSF